MPPPPPPLAGPSRVVPIAWPLAVQPAQPKLKPFFWSKIPNYTVEGTIWASLSSSPSMDLELAMDDLGEVFALDTAPVKSKQKGKTKEVVSVLDISITLTRLRMSPSKIRKAIMEVDDELLEVDDLATLSRMLPTPEEVDKLRTFAGDSSKLSKPDLYFREISIVPHPKLRLEAMVFRRRFEMMMAEIMPDLMILESAIGDLRSSEKLREVFQVVLALGNKMNGGTFRGNAAGFQLDALLKMRETRAAKGSGCPTMLHYLAKILLKRDARLIVWNEDAPALDQAARITLSDLASSINEITSSLSTAQSLLPLLDSDDDLHSLLNEFLNSSTPQIEQLKTTHQRIKSDLTALLQYFGQNSDQNFETSAEELFGLLSSFSRSLEKAGAEMSAHLLKADYTGTSVTTTTSISSSSTTATSATASPEGSRDNTPVGTVALAVHVSQAGDDATTAPSTDGASTHKPPPPPTISDLLLASHSQSNTGPSRFRHTLSRGEFDEAIRTIHGHGHGSGSGSGLLRSRERREASTATLGLGVGLNGDMGSRFGGSWLDSRDGSRRTMTTKTLGGTGTVGRFGGGARGRSAGDRDGVRLSKMFLDGSSAGAGSVKGTVGSRRSTMKVRSGV
ncbi:hypothetical protein I317_02411 [Kwoniella heveanensis CBS 569]|nr:hypothetical protein I317_02411 [Kwoniella heveanensis CBS 569]